MNDVARDTATPQDTVADITTTAATKEVAAARGFLVAHAAMVTALVAIRLTTEDSGEWLTIPLGVASVAVCLVGVRQERGGRQVSEVLWLGLATAWVGLVALDPVMLQAMFTLFGVTFAVVPWPKAVLASALLPIVWGAVEYDDGEPFWVWALLPLAVWLLSCALGLWILRVVEQSMERAAILADLEATRAELAEAQRAEGARMERDRLARDIHDTLAQGFSSIVLHARGALARDDADTTRRTLELVEQVAAEHLGEARQLVATAAKESLGGRTLTEALRRVATADEPTAHVHVDGDPQRLSGAIEVAMLRITQEAVANARKHAQAGRIDVTLAYTDREVLLDVVDDGDGFDLDAAPRSIGGDRGGFGLAGLRNRVAELGGTVVIESKPEAGTSVSVALPMEAR